MKGRKRHPARKRERLNLPKHVRTLIVGLGIVVGGSDRGSGVALNQAVVAVLNDVDIFSGLGIFATPGYLSACHEIGFIVE